MPTVDPGPYRLANGDTFQLQNQLGEVWWQYVANTTATITLDANVEWVDVTAFGDGVRRYLLRQSPPSVPPTPRPSAWWDEHVPATEAAKRAAAAFARVLTIEQQRSWKKNKYILVQGSEGGTYAIVNRLHVAYAQPPSVYRAVKAKAGRFRLEWMVDRYYCIQPIALGTYRYLPTLDSVLAFVCLIEANEGEFLRTGVPSPISPRQPLTAL